MIQVKQTIKIEENFLSHALNERSLDVLARAINLFQGYFSLIIVNCNYRHLRQNLLTSLTSKTGLLYREIWWRESPESLYEKLEDVWKDVGQENPTAAIDNISALMCLGLEQTKATNLENLFSEANLFRDRLKQQLKCPVVIWLGDRELQQFYVQAPELANLAAPPIKFGLSPVELNQTICQQVNRLLAIAKDPEMPLFWQDAQIDSDRQSFSFSELEFARRELRIAHDINNQNNNQSFSQEAEEKEELEAKLDFVLGLLMRRSDEATATEIHEESQGELHSVSQIYYQCSLDYWQKNNKPTESGLVLFYLGKLWWDYGFVKVRQAQSAWTKAKQFFQTAIAAFKQANRNDLIAKYGQAYSDVLEQLKEWEELEVWIKFLLPLHPQHSLELAQDYGYLAKIAVERKAWVQVKEYSSNAFLILKTKPTFDTRFDDQKFKLSWLRLCEIQFGEYQLLLTQSHFYLGEIELAANLIEPTIAKFNRKHEPKLYIRFLDIFHDIAFAQGRYLQAFQTRQQQRSLEQQYGLRAFIGAGVLQPKEPSPNSNITELDRPKFDSKLDIKPDVNVSEITASGRIQDVERLVERILSVEHQLTIIHGESGVGKSSLVKAGLIPALLQRSLTGKELLLLKIRTYTNWINRISFELYQRLNGDRHQAVSDDDLARLQQKYESQNEFGDRHKSGDIMPLLNKFQQLAAHGTQIILILDQFEEFFFINTRSQEKQIFINFWQACLKIPALKLVISIREDYLHLLLELESTHNQVDILSHNFRYALRNLSPSDTKTLIENLTEQANFPLDPSLIDELVIDLAGDRGSVRPIELQIVGSQLQEHNISTLTDYRMAGGKQRLVEQSVEEVIKNCGNTAFIAQQVLILLTDEQGKRPLRTYNELRTGLLTDSNEAYKSKSKLDLDSSLNLVLEILIGSGIIFQIPELESNRYQLVHDYLVPFIRANQETGLIDELRKVRSSAKRSQANLNRLTKLALAGTIVGLLIMTWLTFQATRQRQIAQVGEVKALVSAAKSTFLNNKQLDALTLIIQSAQKLNYIDTETDKNQLTKEIFEELQTIVYNIRERYQFTSSKKDAPFYVAKFSPDGKMIALGANDGSVYLSQSDGKPIAQMTGLQTREIRGLSFSPDGKKIASTGQGKSVRIWDVQTGKLISKFYAHQDDIYRVNFHPDGRKLLTGSKDGTVKLWDSDRGMLIRTFTPIDGKRNPNNNKPEPVQGASFSPNGDLIVIAKNTTISLWDLQGNLQGMAIAHDKPIYNVRFAPDGKQLLSSGRDGSVKLWQISQEPQPAIDTENLSDRSPNNQFNDLNYQISLVRTFKGNASDILSLDFSAKSKHIALGAQDNSIEIFNLDGTSEIKLDGHTDGIIDVNFSPDGDFLVSASKDLTSRLWDLRAASIHTLYGHTSSIWAVSYSPDGKIFASGSVDKSVRLWNADGTLRKELNGHTDTVYGVTFSNDGTKLVSASADKTVRIWDSATGKLLHILDIHGDRLIYATFDPDQKILATLGWDNKIKLWEWNNNNHPKLLQVLDGHSQKIWAIAFSPDGKFLASTGDDQTVKIWDVNNGKNIHSSMPAHRNGGLAVAYSPDGKQIGSAGKDGTLKLWNAQTMVLEKTNTIDERSWIYGISFSPNNQAIAIASADKTIKIIDRASGSRLKTLSKHLAEVYAVSYSLDGQNIVSASRDNTLKLWNANTLSFDELVDRGCSFIDKYLEYTPNLSPDQKQICKQK